MLTFQQITLLYILYTNDRLESKIKGNIFMCADNITITVEPP